MNCDRSRGRRICDEPGDKVVRDRVLVLLDCSQSSHPMFGRATDEGSDRETVLRPTAEGSAINVDAVLPQRRRKMARAGIQWRVPDQRLRVAWIEAMRSFCRLLASERLSIRQTTVSRGESQQKPESRLRLRSSEAEKGSREYLKEDGSRCCTRMLRRERQVN